MIYFAKKSFSLNYTILALPTEQPHLLSNPWRITEFNAHKYNPSIRDCWGINSVVNVTNQTVTKTLAKL